MHNEIYNLIRAALFILLILIFAFFCLTAYSADQPTYTDPTQEPTITIPTAKIETL